MADKSTSVEDIEALEIERERQREILENYKTVDRIVDQRIAPATIDVNHEHSTWCMFCFRMCLFGLSSRIPLQVERADLRRVYVGRSRCYCGEGARADRCLSRSNSYRLPSTQESQLWQESTAVPEARGTTRLHCCWRRIERVSSHWSKLAGLPLVEERQRHSC